VFSRPLPRSYHHGLNVAYTAFSKALQPLEQALSRR
jgi:hypothetical protein